MDNEKKSNTTQKLENINLISINTNSIIANHRRATLTGFLNNKKPDIALLNETKLNARHVLTFSRYNIIRNDNRANIRAGGTAILIREDIEYEIIHEPDIEKNKTIQTTIIKLNLLQNKKLFIVAGYANDKNTKEFIPDLYNLFNTLELKNTNNYFFMAGDLNAKHKM